MNIRKNLAAAVSRTFVLVKSTPKAAIVVPVAAGFLLATVAQAVEPSAPATQAKQVIAIESDGPVPSPLPDRPCSEDNTITRSCYWDAAEMGNGEGRSYVIDDRGNVTYLDPELNSKDRRVAFNNEQAEAGKEHWGTYDGHKFCWAKVGDTSYITCFDGYKTTT
ncbi:hypothetical protein ACFU6R_03100 [Streptomyces sp. NPDC057499]|uniref:hypothetical protein n=1 Tax=Streptomyces sp. NPDC057499 TaxID=3346150 RepID=UPI0036B04481